MRKMIFTLCAAAMIFAGCETTKTAYDSDFSNYDSQVTESNTATERILIYNANIDLIVVQVDSTNASLNLIAAKYGGYVLQSGSYQSSIRVKADQLNSALAEIELLGDVENKNISGTDITEEYTDYQIRLENAKKARERYLELLAKAENVEAALLVEKELERLNNEIELLEGKMNKIGHLAEFSTITIDIREKVKLGILGYTTVGLYEGVKWLFVRN